MTAASPNKYGTINRGDGEVWDFRGPALIFAYLRLEQTILGLILEDDDNDGVLHNIKDSLFFFPCGSVALANFITCITPIFRWELPLNLYFAFF